jgi:uncharacterized membrane protein
VLPLTRVRWRHRRRHLYIVPVAFVVVALVLSWALPAADRAVDPHLTRFEAEIGFVFDSATVAGALSSIASGMIAFTGLVFTLLLLAVQFGTGQLSARLVPLLARDPVIRIALGAFTATFVYALLIAIRLGTRLQDYYLWLSSLFGIALMLLSTVLFFAMVTRMVNLLRVIRVCAWLGRRGIAYVTAHPAEATAVPVPDWPPSTVISHTERPGFLVDVDARALARLARHTGVRMALVPALGEFVRPGAPLLYVWGAGQVSARRARSLVAFADEHTVSGRYPAAMLRVLVDVTLKGLSPGIIDPTTATQALDEIEMLLLALAPRALGQVTVRSADGAPLVDYRLPDWPDYLALATDEVRHYGAPSAQVLRRLRALYLELLDHTAPARHPAVRERLVALDDTVAQRHTNPLDIAVASMPDPSGIGGPAPYRQSTAPTRAGSAGSTI